MDLLKCNGILAKLFALPDQYQVNTMSRFCCKRRTILGIYSVHMWPISVPETLVDLILGMEMIKFIFGRDGVSGTMSYLARSLLLEHW